MNMYSDQEIANALSTCNDARWEANRANNALKRAKLMHVSAEEWLVAMDNVDLATKKWEDAIKKVERMQKLNSLIAA